MWRAFLLFAALFFLSSTIGVGSFTLYYAKGFSYFSNDPKVCMNCHIMSDNYNRWSRSSHRAAATCNDCHTPHGFAGKYVAKASNGFWHSWAFTTGRMQDPLRIKDHNLRIAENNCRSCHAAVFHPAAEAGLARDSFNCTRCHKGVGHPQ